jgi:RNA polymerase sigma-70 factor (ECF subfamily)
MMSEDPGFEKFYQQYAAQLHKTAYRMVENNADAMDIVQEAFLRAMKGFPKFRNESQVKTWLYRIVMNLCYDHFRKRKKISFLPDDQLPARQTAEENFEEKEKRTVRVECLRRSLDALTGRQRAVFTLRIYQELSYDEISRILGIRIGTAKATYFQAVEKLKTAMRATEAKDGLRKNEKVAT